MIVNALKSQNKLIYKGRFFFKDHLKYFTIVITEQHILSKIVNQKEIRVVEMRRIGNHAIINWIQNQLTGQVEFWNYLSKS
ncbi:MAG: hypothetical protein SWX82_12540 [Cyanobacteriota bacterium]|nr:hypothetical protein [Cyanobacteriota bacterium]